MIDSEHRMTLEEGIDSLVRGESSADVAVGLAAEAVALTIQTKGADLAIPHLFALSHIATQLSISEKKP